MSSWKERRYSPWLLKHEESLRKRQTDSTRILVLVALTVAAAEAVIPWDRFTPQIPSLVHIVLVAIILPLLFLGWQSDLRRKEQAFALALSDKGRRLLFLDPYLEPEEFALSEQFSGAHILPLQRQLDTTLKAGAGASLHRRMEQYYRILPSAVHEGDRLGLLSILHPTTFVMWFLMLAAAWACLPGVGLRFAGSEGGLTLLPLLGLLYFAGRRLNTRFGYELALYDWLRSG